MPRRLVAFALSALCAIWVAAPASATPRDTTIRTIQDVDGDNLLDYGPGEDYIVIDGPDGFRPPRQGSIVNFLQLSDFQIIDEESPARVEFLDTTQQPPFLRPFSAAYRPQEALTTQITEAMVRAVRNTVSPVTSEQLEFAILTGDNADSQQFNETRWFIDILDGHKTIDPNSGIEGTCDAAPGSLYDGVKGGGDSGYYDPDSSSSEDGKGYSPLREENSGELTGDVTIRDFPGLFESAQQPFQALGLDLPWYTAFGNHDALIQGNSPDAYIGPFGPGQAGTDAQEDSNEVLQQVATGCVKPVAPPPTFTDPAGFFANPTGAMIVPSDPRRCFLAKDEIDPTLPPPPGPCAEGGWIEQHFRTTGQPVGHGLAPAVDEESQQAGYGRPLVADLNDDGYYSFSPKPGLRFIALDTVTDECGAIVCAEGSVDDAQFDWLAQQLEIAAGMGEYVITYAHHTLRTTRFPSTDPSEQPQHSGNRISTSVREQQPNLPTESTLEDLFCHHENLLVHIVGHEHQNDIREHPCTEEPAAGFANNQDKFYEVSTAAHLDWPQQARMVELVDNGDGASMSLVLTMLDHDGPPNAGGPKPSLDPKGNAPEQVLALASIGRELAYNDYQNDRGSAGTPEDRNVIIVIDKPWAGETG